LGANTPVSAKPNDNSRRQSVIDSLATTDIKYGSCTGPHRPNKLKWKDLMERKITLKNLKNVHEISFLDGKMRYIYKYGDLVHHRANTHR
jgi:hypothetical protein